MLGNLAELAKIMSKAKEMQSKIKEMRAELPNLEFNAVSPDGHVAVVVTGDMQIKQISFNGAAEPAAVAETVNAALSLAKQHLQSQMGEMTGGLGLNMPGLF